MNPESSRHDPGSAISIVMVRFVIMAAPLAPPSGTRAGASGAHRCASVAGRRPTVLPDETPRDAPGQLAQTATMAVMAGDSESESTQRISIHLALAADRSQRAWLCMSVRPRSDGQVRARLELDDVLPSTLSATPAEKSVMKSEIMGGVLMARRHAKRGCSVDLLGLGGEIAGESALTGVPSIAYAIAASLAVLQGLGIEDLRSAPRGGYGWALESIEVADLDD